jgi:phenylalanyl-tRNA synthetase beta subunit
LLISSKSFSVRVLSTACKVTLIPKDKKSVAINVTLQAVDKTLTENDLDEISKKIIDTVSKKTGAIIRS